MLVKGAGLTRTFLSLLSSRRRSSSGSRNWVNEIPPQSKSSCLLFFKCLRTGSMQIYYMSDYVKFSRNIKTTFLNLSLICSLKSASPHQRVWWQRVKVKISDSLQWKSLFIQQTDFLHLNRLTVSKQCQIWGTGGRLWLQFWTILLLPFSPARINWQLSHCRHESSWSYWRLKDQMASLSLATQNLRKQT